MAEIEIPIVTKRNQMTGDYEYPQTHVNGVVGLDEFVETVVQENMPEIPEIEFSDTGWIEYDVNAPMQKNTQFMTSDYNGFVCAYRIINILGVETFYIRFNMRNITSGAVVNLPSGLIRNAQSFPLRTGTARLPVQVSIKPNGTMTFYPNGSDSGWSSSDYVYQEVSFLNN
ncbi:hypothetical protein [Mammaliicoccus sciuri]|uniref:hypothetical protein n=1 Tax=Mammaliicoccus sciuri TaxID=1296 RepID=UPI002888B744|nr:hypothetical protein [Mammaliicoccus sciuri]MDT0754026.1 hypothetical protein [Mammaliicoccus sciuri]